MRLFSKTIPVILLIASIWIACGGPSVVYLDEKSRFDYPVVEVPGRFSMTMTDLYNSIYLSKTLPNGGILPLEDVQFFLDSVLADTLSGFMADEIDLSESYQQYRGFQTLYNRELGRAFFEETVRKKISVDSIEAVEFYHNNPDMFAIPEQILLHQILIARSGFLLGPDSLKYRAMSQEELDQSITAYADSVKNLIDSGMSFGEAAETFSMDIRSSDKRGFVGWTKRNTYHDPFDSIAFALDSGIVSEPYQDHDGWHIITISRRFDEGLQPLDSIFYNNAMTTLVTMRTNERGRHVLDSIYAQPIDIVYNEAILDTNVYKVDRQVWAAIINKTDTIDFNDMRSLEEVFRSNNQIENTTVEMKREIAKELAKLTVLMQSARNAGIDTLDYVLQKEAELKHSFSKRYYSFQKADPSWVPDQEAVQAYYEKHRDDFKVDRPVTIQHIIVKDSTLGEFLRSQALAGNDFIELAKEYYPGEISIRAELANLGAVGPDDVPPRLWEAAMTTPVGDISHPVLTEYGYHIVKVLSRIDTKTLPKVASDIRKVLKRQHNREVFNQFRDHLYEHYHVKFPANLKPVHLRPLDQR